MGCALVLAVPGLWSLGGMAAVPGGGPGSGRGSVCALWAAQPQQCGTRALCPGQGHTYPTAVGHLQTQGSWKKGPERKRRHLLVQTGSVGSASAWDQAQTDLSPLSGTQSGPSCTAALIETASPPCPGVNGENVCCRESRGTPNTWINFRAGSAAGCSREKCLVEPAGMGVACGPLTGQELAKESLVL